MRLGSRTRAAAFGLAAAACAAVAAASAGGRDAGSDLLGELRDVVVARAPLAARRPLAREDVARRLEVRRLPARFVAADALLRPADAAGRRPATTIPPGSYLVASQFLTSRQAGSSRPRLAPGRRPVEIAVVGSGALSLRPGGARERVDVVVTTGPSANRAAGRTFVAARGVALLDLRAAGAAPAAPGPAGGESSIATLALTRAQALRLIHAQSFAREVRLIGR